MSDSPEKRQSGRIRRPTFISYAPTNLPRVSEQRLLVASLSVAERRAQIRHSGATTVTNSSRRRENNRSAENIEGAMFENELLRLCRMQDWGAVLHRCSSHQEEAIPALITKEDTCNKGGGKSLQTSSETTCNSRQMYLLDQGYLETNRKLMQIYGETALGLVCASEFCDKEKMYCLVKTILMANPNQVQCSQRLLGCTPLRDAVQNPSCTPEVLSLLLETDFSLPGEICRKAVKMKDRDGLQPIDHLIMSVHVQNSDQSLLLLDAFLDAKGVDSGGKTHSKDCSCANGVSPLIRLLSIGSSYGLHVHSSRGKQSQNEAARLARILQCTRLIVERNRQVLLTRARSTQCTALHVALRNYGNYMLLVDYLLDADDIGFMIKQRNLYGDLPLHVACSAGVPEQVLRRVVEATLKAAPKQPDSPHPLIWSTNISGYTAVDLEWMRHIEGGGGFFERRTFYPLEACGIRWHCSRQDEFYRDLLREAVDKVLETDRQSIGDRLLQSESLGVVLDRIFFLVQVAHVGAVPNCLEECTSFLVHAAASLSRLPGPCLPNPLLDLIHWMKPDQIFQVDYDGRLPIHYVVMSATAHDKVTLTTRRKDKVIIQDYLRLVQFLLHSYPSAAIKTDRYGRLALHFVVAGDMRTQTEPWGCISSSEPDTEMMTARYEVLSLLASTFPESVDTMDPLTGLYPFMEAAENSSMNLNMVYCLLKRSPALVGLGIESM